MDHTSGRKEGCRQNEEADRQTMSVSTLNNHRTASSCHKGYDRKMRQASCDASHPKPIACWLSRHPSFTLSSGCLAPLAQHSTHLQARAFHSLGGHGCRGAHSRGTPRVCAAVCCVRDAAGGLAVQQSKGGAEDGKRLHQDGEPLHLRTHRAEIGYSDCKTTDDNTATMATDEACWVLHGNMAPAPA